MLIVNQAIVHSTILFNESFANDKLTYGPVYPVALADVYGDEVPELIFMRGSSASNNDTYFVANLVVCTYEDSMVKTLYDEKLDLQVAGGTNFCVFTGKDKCLYRYDGIGDEGWEYNYSCLTGSNGIMSETDKILLSGDNDDEVLIRIAQKNGMEALTYEEAVSELTALAGSALQNDTSVSSSGSSDSGTAGSTTSSNAAYADVFRNMSERSLYFASGAGGWDSELEGTEDGTFTGEYHDSEMGVTGDGFFSG